MPRIFMDSVDKMSLITFVPSWLKNEPQAAFSLVKNENFSKNFFGFFVTVIQWISYFIDHD